MGAVPGLSLLGALFFTPLSDRNTAKLADFLNDVASHLHDVSRDTSQIKEMLASNDSLAPVLFRVLEHARKTESVEKIQQLKNILLNYCVTENCQEDPDTYVEIASALSPLNARVLHFYSRVKIKKLLRDLQGPIDFEFDGQPMYMHNYQSFLGQEMSKVGLFGTLVGAAVEQLRTAGLLEFDDDYNAMWSTNPPTPVLTQLTDVGWKVLHLLLEPREAE